MFITYLILAALSAGAILSLAFVVYAFLTIYNLAYYIKQYDTNNADRVIVESIEGARRVKVGLKNRSGNRVAEATIDCPEGHNLRVGNSTGL
jgi:hypothetical protein